MRSIKILEMTVAALVAEREIFHRRCAAFGKGLQMFKRRIFAGIGDAIEAHEIAAIPAVIPVALSHGGDFGLLGLPLEKPGLSRIILPFCSRCRHADS